MWRMIVRAVLAAAVLAAPLPSFAESVTVSRSTRSLLATGAENVLRTAYERVGIDLNVMELPRQRSLVSAIEGISDGEVIRGPMELADHEGFRLIDPPLTHNEVAVFRRRDSGIEAADLASLAEYSVAYLNGIKAHRQLAETAGNAVKVETPDLLLKMLDAGRVDLVVINPIGARVRLASGEYANIDPEGIVIKSEPLHHYLRDDLGDVADAIEEILQEMERTGELEQAFEDGITQFQAAIAGES